MNRAQDDEMASNPLIMIQSKNIISDLLPMSSVRSSLLMTVRISILRSLLQLSEYIIITKLCELLIFHELICCVNVQFALTMKPVPHFYGVCNFDRQLYFVREAACLVSQRNCSTYVLEFMKCICVMSSLQLQQRHATDN